MDVAPAPPAQGLFEVRLLPDPLNCVSKPLNLHIEVPPLTVSQRWSPFAGQHGPGTVFRRREEEGLLDTDSSRIMTRVSIRTTTFDNVHHIT